MRHWLKKRYLVGVFSVIFLVPAYANGEDGYLGNYDPQKGFTPAQRSLTTTFLKLAGSLEHSGDPEIYMRWVLKENARIDAKYAKVFGKSASSRPPYLTDEYIGKLLKQWRDLERPLQLKKLSHESGKHMRYAILGEWHKSPEEIAAEEGALTEGERGQYRQLLAKDYFEKADDALLQRFYADGAGYDKLSAAGKKQMSQRYWLAKMPPEKRKEELARYTGGTIIVDIFNEYQQLLLEDMKKPGKRTTSFDTLQAMLEKRLRLGEQVNDLNKLAWNEKDAIWHSHMVRGMFWRGLSYLRGRSAKRVKKARRSG